MASSSLQGFHGCTRRSAEDNTIYVRRKEEGPKLKVKQNIKCQKDFSSLVIPPSIPRPLKWNRKMPYSLPKVYYYYEKQCEGKESILFKRICDYIIFEQTTRICRDLSINAKLFKSYKSDLWFIKQSIMASTSVYHSHSHPRTES